MKKTLLLLNLFVFQLACAQKGGRTLCAALLDSSTRQPLQLATVALYRESDTSMVAFRLSDEAGRIKMPGVPNDQRLYLLVTHTGYKAYRTSIDMHTGDLDLGKVQLMPDTSQLDAAVVTAEIPPVTIRHDTIEFNVASFKTRPDALVKDLLKKLPGVDIDSKGRITVQGRIVNKIYVDGKDFFGSSPAVASSNLPANIVDKVQVMEDKEDSLMHPNAPTWAIGRIINLKLRKNVRNGAFGKLYAGGGTDDRYQAGLILNSFRDTLQASLIGYANNTNSSAGFSMSDLQQLGGFNRSGYSVQSSDESGVTNIDNVSLGGSSEGIQQSSGAGLNLNYQAGKKTTLNLIYFYTHTANDLRETTDTKQWLADSTLTSLSNITQTTTATAHLLSLGIREKFSPFSQLRFKPVISWSASNEDYHSISTSTSSNVPVLNSSDNQFSLASPLRKYSHVLSYTNTNVTKPGGSLTITNSLSIRNGGSNQYSRALSRYFNSASGMLDQLRQTSVPSLSTATDLVYTQPLGGGVRLDVTSNVRYSHNKQQVLTDGPDTTDAKYDALIDSLSSALIRCGLWTSTKAGIAFKPASSLSLSTGLQVQTIDIDNDQRPGHIEQHYLSPLPFVDVTWKDLVSLSYSTQFTETGIDQLIGVRNNTDPLNQTIGNPLLHPQLTHTLGLSVSHYDQQRLVQVYASLFANFYINSVVMARTVSANGVQVTQPYNSDFSRNLSFYAEISKQYKYASGWQLSLRANVQAGWTRSLFAVNAVETAQQLYGLTPTGSVDLNWKDKVMVDASYFPTVNISTYTTPGYTNLNYTIHNLNGSVSYLPPGRFFLETSVVYQYNPVNAAFSRNHKVLWNASLNGRLLKRKNLLLKLSVYDLLDQNNGLSTQISQNWISSTQSNVLKRYAMLTVSYDLRSFGH